MKQLHTRRLLSIARVANISSAWAGAGLVVTQVTPLQANVSYSVLASGSAPALHTYVGYAITVSNDPGNTNTINNVRFTGTSSVTDAAGAATFVSAEGLACTASNGGRSIECPIGQLRAGQSVSFAVFFNAPQKAVNGVADGPNEDSVQFSGATYYAEGTGGLDNSIPQNSTSPFAAAPVLLGTNSPILVRSAVQKSGGQIFTGSGAAATAADTWTTTVDVPATATYTTSVIAESSDVPIAPNRPMPASPN